jgi:hypothetical protein
MKDKNPPREPITARVDPWVIEALEKKAEQLGLLRSEYVRRVLTNNVEA